MDDASQNFISSLYISKLASRQEVDEAVSYWQMLQKRGQDLDFDQVAVKRGLISKAQARQIIRDIEESQGSSQASQASTAAATGAAAKARSQGKTGPKKEDEESGLGLPHMVGIGLVLLAFVIALPRLLAPAEVKERIELGEEEVEEDLAAGMVSYAERRAIKADSLVADRRFAEALKTIRQAEDSGGKLSDGERLILKEARRRAEATQDRVRKLAAARRSAQEALDGGDVAGAERILSELDRRSPGVAEEPEYAALKDLKQRLKRERTERPAPPRKRPREETAVALNGASRARQQAARKRITELNILPAKAIEPGRKKYFKKKLWSSRLKHAQAWILEAKAERTKLLMEERQRVLAASREKPFEVQLTDTMTMRDGVVKRYDDEGFSIAGKRAEVGYRWEIAEPALALRVRELGVDPTQALSLMRFGKFCLRLRFFKEARRAFQKAIAFDRRLAVQVPRIDLLEKAAAAFNGKVELLGRGLVRLQYGFADPKQLRDFELAGARPFRPRIRDGAVLIPSPKDGTRNLLALKEVYFEDRVFIEVAMKDRPQEVTIALFVGTGRKQRGWEFIYNRTKGQALLVESGAKKERLLGPLKVKRRGRRLSLSLKGRDIRVRLDGRTIARLRSPALQGKAAVLIGGRGPQGVALDRLRVEGKVPAVWLRRTFREADDIINAALADRGVGAPESSWRRRPERLSVEDPIMAKKLDPKARRLIIEARQLRREGTYKSLNEALVKLTQAVKLALVHPLPFYERARVKQILGLKRSAFVDLNWAVRVGGGFHEALAWRAVLLSELGRPKAAEQDWKAAFAIRPDGAEVLVAAGRLQFSQEHIAEAARYVELGYALWPRHKLLATLNRNYANVVKGPPWERTFKVRTEHYEVWTDLSQERTQIYADRLETIHAYYSKLFPSHFQDRRDRVVIFRTREGYRQYSSLTLNDRVESTLGYFHPKFRQLLLFEDKEDIENPETVDTLNHEGFHQFIYGVCKELPRWLNEGMAEYFGATEFNSDGRLKSAGGLQLGRLAELREYLSQGGRALSFRSFMTEPPQQFMTGPVSLKYAQAWSMIHFFMRGKKGQRRLLKKYFSLLRLGHSQEEAYRQSYGGADLKTLERDWLKYVKALPLKARRR